MQLAPVAASLLGFLIILTWQKSYSAGCLTLLLPFLVLILLSLALREITIVRRTCLANCYFEQDSFFHRLLRGKMLATLMAFFMACIFTLALMTAVINWQQEVMLLLCFDAMLIALIYLGLRRLTHNSWRVRPAMANVLAKRFSVIINIPLLLVALMYLQLEAQPPAYLDPAKNLKTNLQSASSSLHSQCYWTDRAVRLLQEKEALAWWMMLKASASIKDKQLKWAAWMIFLISGTLGVWGYSRLCLELADLGRKYSG